MTTLTQHSPSLSSPHFAINGSAAEGAPDYFSIQIPTKTPITHTTLPIEGSHLDKEHNPFVFPIKSSPFAAGDVEQRNSAALADLQHQYQQSTASPGASRNNLGDQDIIMASSSPSPSSSLGSNAAPASSPETSIRRSLSKKLKISEIPKKFINISQSLKSSSSDAEAGDIDSPTSSASGSAVDVSNQALANGKPLINSGKSSKPPMVSPNISTPDQNKPLPEIPQESVSLTSPIKEFIKASPNILKGSSHQLRSSKKLGTLSHSRPHSLISHSSLEDVSNRNTVYDRKHTQSSASSISSSSPQQPPQSPQNPFAMAFEEKRKKLLVRTPTSSDVNLSSLSLNEGTQNNNSLYSRSRIPAYLVASNFNKAMSMGQIPEDEPVNAHHRHSSLANRSVVNASRLSGAVSLSNMSINSDRKYGHEKASPSLGSINRVASSSGHNSHGSISSTPKDTLYKTFTNSSISSLPNISSAYYKRKSQRTLNNQDLVHDLPQDAMVLSIDELANFFQNDYFLKNHDQGSTYPFKNFVIIDIRSFNEYAKSRITNAINISLPTTLLKRNNYTLSRTISSLSNFEKGIFTSFLNQQQQNISNNLKNYKREINGIPCGPFGLPSILLYDSHSMINDQVKSSFSLSCMVSKFLSNNSWNAPVFVLKGGFEAFAEKYPSMVDSNEPYKTTIYMKTKQQKQKDLEKQSQPVLQLNLDPHPYSHQRGQSSLTIDTASINQSSINGSALDDKSSLADSKYSANSVLSTSSASSILSGFQLPAAKHFFRVRQNDEMINVENCTEHIKLNNLDKLKAEELDNLPKWFLNALAPSAAHGYGSRHLVEKFGKLEMLEKERLNKIMTVESYDSFNSQNIDNDVMPRISGVEMGHKNRYKDILPFENTRVLIPKNKNGCDYINASYLTSIDSQPISAHKTVNKPKFFKYIATQGPLNNTICDFWRMVYGHRSPIIISLTEEKDGYMEKCANFWKSQISHDNGTVKVEQLECTVLDSASTREFTGSLYDQSAHIDNSIVVRRIMVEIDENAKHEVLQFQFKHWHDLGSFTNYDELLLVVFLKRFIMEKYSQLVLEHDKLDAGISDDVISNIDDIPIVVHCSAGCGRTGTFCSIDSAIGYELNHSEQYKEVNEVTQSATSTPKIPLFNFEPSNPVSSAESNSYSNETLSSINKLHSSETLSTLQKGDYFSNVNNKDKFDPVFENVNVFRKQRLSMVQTLRQYLLIYDTLLIFHKYRQNDKLRWFENIGSDIQVINNFFEDWKTILQ